jgi:hypothetical protein
VTDHDERQEPKVEPGHRVEAELTDMIQQQSARSRPLAGVIRAEETAAPESGTWKIEQGIDVLCQDGEKIGEVVEIRPGYLVVEEGFFDPRDLYVPLELIEDHDETQLTLSITREMFEASDWIEEPDVEAEQSEDESRPDESDGAP